MEEVCKELSESFINLKNFNGLQQTANSALFLNVILSYHCLNVSRERVNQSKEK